MRTNLAALLGVIRLSIFGISVNPINSKVPMAKENVR